MQQIIFFWQSVIAFMEKNLEDIQEIYHSYDFFLPDFTQWIFVPRTDLLLFTLFLALVIMLAVTMWLHPIFFLARNHGLQKVSWRSANNFYNFSQTAKVLAENEHYGFKPDIDIIIHQNRLNIFTTMELFCLGRKRFTLCIPEKKWIISNDGLIARLLRPKISLKRRYFFLSTMIFMVANSIKLSQKRTFFWIQSHVHNKNIQNFLLISLYIFFLPLLYTRLKLRSYFYIRLMSKLYGDELSLILSKELLSELEEFHNKPITYFFGQIHETA